MYTLFDAEEHILGDRKLSDEAMDWYRSTIGSNFYIVEDHWDEDKYGNLVSTWTVMHGNKAVTAFDDEDIAKRTCAELQNQKFTMGLLIGKGNKARQWFVGGEGQHKVANSTGWTDL